MIQHDAVVIDNRQVGKACWLMGLETEADYGTAVPGQFVMFQIGSTKTALLRRPFSIFGLRINNGRNQGIELLYKAVGQVTDKMTELAPGNRVNLLGPLGRGFRVPNGHTRLFFVAGGIGVAPIRFLIHHLKAKAMVLDNCHLFLGGRSSDELLCRDELAHLGMALSLTTDDGSAGRQCLITDPLADAMQAEPPQAILACGPHGMLQCLAGLANTLKVPCQVSMETHMACGIGACLGCAVRPAAENDPYRHVCRDGPVFDVADLSL